MSLEIPRRHTRGHSWAMSAALVSLLIGIARAQGIPNLPSGCPSPMTLTVLPSDYSGSLLNIPTSLWPSLSTFSLPSLPSISLPDLSLTVPPISLPSLALPTLNPSATLDVPTISLPVSAILPTIPLPSGTPVSYTCFEADNRIIVQNGLPYAVDCGATAIGSVYTTVPAVSSFNDCFLQCDRSSTSDGAKYCTGFSYDGGSDGQGSGTCYLQNSVAQGFTTVQSTSRVAAVRLLNYIAGGNVPLSTLLPSNLPITTELPNGDSSLLGGLTSGLPTNLPLTIDLPNGPSSLLGGVTSGLPNGASSLLNGLTSGLTLPTGLSITDASGLLSSLVGGFTGALPTTNFGVPISSLGDQLSGLLGNPTQGVPGAVSSLLGSQGIPSVISSILANPSSGAILSSLLSNLTATPSITLPVSLPTNILPSGSFPSMTIGLPTTLPSDIIPSLSLPSGSLPSLSISLPTGSLPSISIPSGNLPSLTNIIPTSLPTAIIPPISSPQGTNLITTTGANGVPTVVSITPSIVAPSLTVSQPLDLSLSGVLTNYITTTGLGGVTTLIPAPPSLSLSIPSLSFSAPSISTTSLSVPTLSVSAPNISGPSFALSTPSISIPTISVPSASIPTLSLSAPTLSLSIQSRSILVPSLSLLVPSFSASLPTNIIPSGSGGNPLSSLLPTTSIVASLSRPSGATGSSNGNPLVAPTATAYPIFGCPFDSGLAYVSPAGQAFMITCSTQSLGYDISQALQPDLVSCVNSCGNVQGCTSAAFQASTKLCSYKSQNGQSIGASADFSTAVAIDLSCPNGNGVVYMDAYGSIYQILCNYTFPSRTEIAQSPATTGRLVDERSLELEKRAPSNANFLACSIRCSALSGCLAVTETNNVCIFISSLGSQGTGSNIADTVILVAKRVVTVNAAGTTVTSTSAAASAPTVGTSRSATVYNPPASTPNLGLSSLSGVSLSIPTSLQALSVPPLSASLGLSGSLGLSASAGLSASLGLSGSVGPLLPTGPGCGGALQPACPVTTPTSSTTASATSACTPRAGVAGLGAIDCSTSTTSECTPRAGVAGIGAVYCPTYTTTTSSSVSRTQVTITVPVTTLVTTSTITSCSTNLANQVVCPTVNVTETLVGTRTIVTNSYVTSTSSTLATSTRSSSSSLSSSASTSSRSSSTSTARSSSSAAPLVCIPQVGVTC